MTIESLTIRLHGPDDTDPGWRLLCDVRIEGQTRGGVLRIEDPDDVDELRLSIDQCRDVILGTIEMVRQKEVEA